MPPESTLKRAAVGGSLFFLTLAVVLVAFGRSVDRDDHAPPPAGVSQALVLFDGDAHGAIVAQGATMIGLAADGAVRWRLPLGPNDLLPFATCLQACPEAEVTVGRSGSVPPDRADGPRLRFTAPRWRPEPQGLRRRIDRPLLPAANPARIEANATGRPRIVLAGADARLMDFSYLTALASNRRTAVLVQRGGNAGQRGLVLHSGGKGWRLGRRIAVGGGVQSACLTADGGVLALVGGGPPRTTDLMASQARPTVVEGWHKEERHAGMCAVGGGTVATAIMKSASGVRQTVLTVHAGARHRHVVRLPGQLPLGLWTSARTGVTAILHGGEIVLVTRTGARRAWSNVTGAVPIGDRRLLLLRGSGPPTVRGF